VELDTPAEPFAGFAPGWEDAFDSQGARERVHLKRLFGGRR
jgi:hypothetical protein